MQSVYTFNFGLRMRVYNISLTSWNEATKFTATFRDDVELLNEVIRHFIIVMNYTNEKLKSYHIFSKLRTDINLGIQLRKCDVLEQK